MTDARMFRFRRGAWALGEKTYILGILNITPDSFSDGSVDYRDPTFQMEKARRLVEEGADGLDLGAESTRPGYVPVDWHEEWQRLEPILDVVQTADLGVPISVDTVKYEVASRALAHGADIINDIWGLSREPRLARLAAKAGAGVIAMFNGEGTASDPVSLADIRRFFHEALDTAVSHGLTSDQVLMDPGLGFRVQGEASWHVLAHLKTLAGIGAGLLIGPSRKRFLGRLLEESVPERRDLGTAVTAALAALHGADVVRVHSPAMVRQALLIAQQWRAAGG